MILGLAAVILPGCGSSSTDPTVVPTPVPRTTPRPPIQLTLDPPDGFYQFSGPLAELSTGQSFELRFVPVQVNPGDSGYANTVEFWLWSLTTDMDSFVQEGIASSLQWLPDSDSNWLVYSFTPQELFSDTGQRFRIELGTEHAIRIVRRDDGTSEFFLDGLSILTIPDRLEVRVVHARAVGFTADFEFQAEQSAARALSRERHACEDRGCS